MEIVQQQFEGKQLRAIERDGQPWFVLADVCAVLDLSSPHKVADRLDEDEKGRSLIPTPGGQQEMTVVNESGLYAVILRSDKPQARAFRKWVTNEVLPSLRVKGSYSVEQAAPTTALISARMIAETLSRSSKAVTCALTRAHIAPTHHFLDPRCHAPSYLYPLDRVAALFPETLFPTYVGEVRAGTAVVEARVALTRRGKLNPPRPQQQRLLPSTDRPALARELVALEERRAEILAALA